MAKLDMAQIVTDETLEKMEAGGDPWEIPHNATGGMPRNAIKGNFYHGVNPFILWHVASHRG